MHNQSIGQWSMVGWLVWDGIFAYSFNESVRLILLSKWCYYKKGKPKKGWNNQICLHFFCCKSQVYLPCLWFYRCNMCNRIPARRSRRPTEDQGRDQGSFAKQIGNIHRAHVGICRKGCCDHPIWRSATKACFAFACFLGLLFTWTITAIQVWNASPYAEGLVVCVAAALQCILYPTAVMSPIHARINKPFTA